mgnify:CR=1 FL=1
MRPMALKPRILIVEDESGIADTLQYVLSTDGFAPVWASTAEHAIAQFSAELLARVPEAARRSACCWRWSTISAVCDAGF